MKCSWRGGLVIALVLCTLLSSGWWLYKRTLIVLPQSSTFEPVIEEQAPPQSTTTMMEVSLQGFERSSIVYQNQKQGIEISMPEPTETVAYGWRLIPTTTLVDAVFAAELIRVTPTTTSCQTRLWVVPGMVPGYGNTIGESGLGDYNIMGNGNVHVASDDLSLCDAEITFDLGAGLLAEHRIVPASMDCHDARLRWRDTSKSSPVVDSLIEAFHDG